MKRLIIALVLSSAQAYAALAAATVWEVRTTGTTTSGGGYSTGGTDMSIFDNKNAAACTSCQSATVNISTTDGVAAGTTTITSLTGNYSSALIGNVVNISGGTGSITSGWYQVASVTNSTTFDVDRSTGLTTGTGVTVNIGGAVSTIGTALAVVVAGNTVWVKATATYSTSANTSFATAGTTGLPITTSGYTSTRGDNGKATVQLSAGTGLNMFNLTAALNKVHNFVLDCNTKGTSRGLSATSGTQYLFDNIQSKNCTTSGFTITAQGALGLGLNATGMTSAATAGFVLGAATFTCRQCSANANASPGFVANGGANTYTFLVGAISANNTGASSDGFQVNNSTSSSESFVCEGCIAYNNGRDGLRAATAASSDAMTFRNSIFVSNAGYGINSTATDWSGGGLDLDYNAFYNNTLGARNQVAVGAHDVTLTADPFTNGASVDFSLNSTSGGGTALKAVGYPGAYFNLGTTGYRDIGAVQRVCPAGGGTTSCASQ